MNSSARNSSRRSHRAGLAEPLQQVGRTEVLVGRRQLTYFAGCDYFRLASHPEIAAAIRAGLDGGSVNVAASRRTTGNHRLYEQLERALQSFFAAESATLTSNGYQANLCVGQALAGEMTHALLDERAHASLRDAATLLGCRTAVFRHRDPADLRRVAARCGRRARVLVMTDGLFAHSGEVAPLADYLAVLPRNARMLVDDAHAAGILGRHGRGTPEHFDLPGDVVRSRLIHTITLSKAFGVYGGAVLGSLKLRERIVERSHLFIGNTPLPLPLVHGALQALEIVRQNPRLRRRLIFNTAFVKASLREAQILVNDGPGPILPIRPSSHRAAARLSQALRRAGIHPPLIQYPGVGGPGAAYFRFALSSEHDGGQLDSLVRTVSRWQAAQD
jgi:7-keto-8-aminopelargonate synthetase-like enzyme